VGDTEKWYNSISSTISFPNASAARRPATCEHDNEDDPSIQGNDQLMASKKDPKKNTTPEWGTIRLQYQDDLSKAEAIRVVDDGRRFLDRWRNQAMALGWREEDAADLIWSLRGREVIWMTSDSAAIAAADTKWTATFCRQMAHEPRKAPAGAGDKAA
jgi:hypothetical protein